LLEHRKTRVRSPLGNAPAVTRHQRDWGIALMESTDNRYILRATGIRKSFGGVQALKGVSLEIGKAEIHCLAGENGCGKSTLIKIISGVHAMDAGELELDGVRYSKITPLESIVHGVQVIYQDLSVFPNLTVKENIAISSEVASRRRLVSWRRVRKIAEEAARMVELSADLNSIVGQLSVAEKQQVAISRALINDARLIIMDEPTTALTRREVQTLFRIIKRLQSQGIAILFVSHKLDEVFEISERFTILRNGENVITDDTSRLNSEDFTFYMTGRRFEKSRFEANPTGARPILEVKDLGLKNGFTEVSFSVYAGEIVGITGLLGSGRTELAQALFGIRRADQGSIYVDGREVKISSAMQAMACGIGYVPEDRLTEGLFLTQPIGTNIIISKIDQLTGLLGLIDEARVSGEISRWVERLAIHTTDPGRPAQTLSGGNQQRVVLAKWMSRDMKVLILNGPTMGVDIGSKHDIHEILKSLARTGLGIIVISDDLPEVLSLCSRILVMKSGRLSGTLEPRNVSERELAEICVGG